MERLGSGNYIDRKNELILLNTYHIFYTDDYGDKMYEGINYLGQDRTWVIWEIELNKTTGEIYYNEPVANFNSKRDAVKHIKKHYN